METTAPLLPPGFRFHPTDEELVTHYLKKKASSTPLPVPIIAEIDLYKFDPWELPGKASFGEHEWYFFSPRDRKYPNGARPNRAAVSGYWKATGTDKPILASGHKVGVKKALVFYKGRPPKGIKTSWIMHEYRLTDTAVRPASFSARKSLRLDDWVLCRIYKKSTHSPKGLIREEASCVEEVLASLPDIDDPKLSVLPRLGSFGVLGDADSFLEFVITGPEATQPISVGTLPKMDVPIPQRQYTFPVSNGIVPKSESRELDTGKFDLSLFSRGCSQYFREDDCNLLKRGMYSLPTLTQRNPLLHQPKSQTHVADTETSCKWVFPDKSRF